MRTSVLIPMVALLCACQQGGSSGQRSGPESWVDRPCVEIPVPSSSLGPDWVLSINATSEAPGQRPQIITDHTRGPVCRAEIAMLLGKARPHGVLKGCNFGYIRKKGEKENWFGDFSTNALVFGSPDGAENFFRERIATWERSPAGSLVDDLGDTGWLFRSSVSRAFFRRGVVYVEIESLSAYDDVEKLARSLDRHVAGDIE